MLFWVFVPWRVFQVLRCFANKKTLFLAGPLYCLKNLLVAGAAAEVAREGLFDLFAGRVGVFVQEGHRSEDHPRGAESALDRAGGDEGLLDRMELAVFFQTFDSNDLVRFI